MRFAISAHKSQNAKSPDHCNNDQGFLKNNLAAFYSPTQSPTQPPMQYHRR
jgi:hypothetical protein